MTKLEEEYGRSMVEMLGVLAIIGVLSVAGVSGYTTAMNKHRANEILNEASKRALIVASQIVLGQEPNLNEFTNNNVGGAVFSTTVTKEGADKFVIGYTTPPSADVQAQILAMIGSGSMVRRFSANGGLVFNNDLTTTPKASDYNGDKTKCTGTYCSGSGLCLESGESCTCSGTAPACQKCDPATGEFVADADKNGQQDGCESGKTCDNGSCKTAGCSADADCYTICPDDWTQCREEGAIGECSIDRPYSGASRPFMSSTGHGDDGSKSFTYCQEDNKCRCRYQCYPADTLITLADGTTKRVDEITYDDKLLVWNFDEGHFDSAYPLWLKVAETAQEYNYLKFSDGSVLKTINQHRIFNREKGMFTYPMTDDTPIGTHTFNAKGEWVTLVEKRVVQEEVVYYNIITDYHMNCFVGNILTSCRLNNLYPIQDMKFVKDNRQIVPYSEFAELPRKWYDGLRLGEQPTDINRENAVVFDKTLIDYAKRLIAIAQ